MAWIRAGNVDSIERTSRALAFGSLLATGGASTAIGSSSTYASLLAGYMKEDLKGAASAAALSIGFKEFAMKLGVPAAAADKAATTLGLAYVWDDLVDEMRR
jgi:hypothetical protein